MTGRNRPDGGTCEADEKEAGHDLTLTQVLELRQEDEPGLRSQSPLGSGQPTPQALNLCSTEVQPTNGTVCVINTSPVELAEFVLEDSVCANSCGDALSATNLDMEGTKGVSDRVVLASMACHGGNEGVQPGSIAEVDADELKIEDGAEGVHGLCEVMESSEGEGGDAQQQQQEQQQQSHPQEPEQRRQQDQLPNNGIDTESCRPHEDTKERSSSPVRSSSAKRKRTPCSSEHKRSREVACLRDCNKAGASTKTRTPGKSHKPPTTTPRHRNRRRPQEKSVPAGYERLGPYVPSGTDYGVELIIDMRVMPDQKREFLCRWHGHSETWATWEMEEFLPTDMVQPYLKAWDERVKTWRANFEEDDEERREQRKNKKGVRRRGRTTVEETVSDCESEARTEPLEQQDDEQHVQLLSDEGGAWEPDVEGEEEMKAGPDGVKHDGGVTQCGGIEDVAQLPVHAVAEMDAARMAEQNGSVEESFGIRPTCSTT